MNGARPTIEEMRERKRRVDQALYALTVGTFRKCLKHVEARDLGTVRMGLVQQYEDNPTSLALVTFEAQIDREVERRKNG